MKTIIAGSRNITNYEALQHAVTKSQFTITEVVSGGARGADKLGEDYAHNNSLQLTTMPADWNAHGKRAGYLRNEEMANYAEALIALWDGHSSGTKHMINLAKRKGLKVFVLLVQA